RKKVLAIAACRRRNLALVGSRGELLRQNYEPHFVGGDRIAGQAVDIVDLRPRQPGSVWKRFWISKANHVVVAATSFAPNGQKISSFRFQEVVFQPPAAARAEEFEAPAELVRRYGRA